MSLEVRLEVRMERMLEVRLEKRLEVRLEARLKVLSDEGKARCVRVLTGTVSHSQTIQ